jgi:dethiobiotin synthetase
MRGLIVTGTDTGIGKTVLAAGLVGALTHSFGQARYWKPVQAGLAEETDSAAVARLVPGATVHAEAYRLVTPASPHLAARIDGVDIVAERLALPAGAGPIIVEGAGGALVPLSETRLYAEQFVVWGLPVVIVARTGLGTINHSLLTIEALRARGVPMAGIAFVGPAEPESEAIIATLGQVRRLGRLPILSDLTPVSLAAAMAEHFDLVDIL